MATATPTRRGPAAPADPPQRQDLLPWLGLACRVALAAVFAVAGASKITDPDGTVRAVTAYRLISGDLVTVVAHALPAMELVLAAALLIGVATRVAALLASTMLVVFVGAIISVDARGLRIDCGCFGGGGATATPHYGSEIARDLVLVVVAVALVRLSPGRLSVDGLGSPPVTPRDVATSKAVSQARARAAAARAEQQHHADVSRRLFLGGGLGVALVAAGGIGVATGAAHDSSARTAAAAADGPAVATAGKGFLVGAAAPKTLVVYVDPQCPICREFETTQASTLAQVVSAGTVQLEYRVRTFLGPESVRAANALALAALEGKFADLLAQMFGNQPKEGTGGYTTDDLVARGASVGLVSDAYVQGVRSGRYAAWASAIQPQFDREDPSGTPYLVLDGTAVPQATVFDATAFPGLLAS